MLPTRRAATGLASGIPRAQAVRYVFPDPRHGRSMAASADRRPVPAAVRAAVEEFARGVRRAGGRCILQVTLFGSAARGVMNPESDVDLLVLYDGDPSAGRDLAMEVAVEVGLRHGLLLMPHIMSPDLWQKAVGMGTPLTQDLSREGIVVEG